MSDDSEAGDLQSGHLIRAYPYGEGVGDPTRMEVIDLPPTTLAYPSGGQEETDKIKCHSGETGSYHYIEPEWVIEIVGHV